MAFRDVMNDVMNFLGLVTDEEHEQRRNMNKNNSSKVKKRSAAGNYGSDRYADDDFDTDEPQVSRVPRGGRNSSGRSYAQSDDDIFDADRLFSEDGYNPRPSYSTRSGSSAQRSGARANAQQSSRYGSYTDESARSYGTGRSRTTNYEDRGESTMNTRENARPTGSRQTTVRQNEGGRYQMAVRKLKTVDECREVIQLLLANTTVVMSLEEMDTVQAQRVVDTMGGATFAIGAKMNKTSARGWILTPSSVDVENKYGTGSDSPF